MFGNRTREHDVLLRVKRTTAIGWGAIGLGGEGGSREWAGRGREKESEKEGKTCKIHEDTLGGTALCAPLVHTHLKQTVEKHMHGKTHAWINVVGNNYNNEVTIHFY